MRRDKTSRSSHRFDIVRLPFRLSFRPPFRPPLIGSLLFSSLLLAGCGLFSKATPLPAPVLETPLTQAPIALSLTINVDKDVNEDSNGRPSPVRLRAFLVEQDVELVDKPFNEIFDFGGTEIDPRPSANIVLKPGAQEKLILYGNKSQTKLVLAAGYREPYQAIWILQTAVDILKDPFVSAGVTKTAITLSDAQ